MTVFRTSFVGKIGLKQVFRICILYTTIQCTSTIYIYMHPKLMHSFIYLTFIATVCGENTFMCNSGQCIDVSLYCDYIQHCDDASDETSCGK